MKPSLKRPLGSIKRNLSFLLTGSSEHPEFIINHEKKYAYLVNSKAACTAIKSSIIEDIYGKEIFDQNPHHVKLPKGCRVFGPQKLPKDYFVFTFVREPRKRIVSLYKNKFRQPELLFKDGFYFQNYLGGYFSLQDSLHDFVEKICDVPERLADRHFVSQSHLIRQSKANVNVYRLEEIESRFNDISNKLGIPALKVKNNSTGVSKDILIDDRIEDLLIKRYRKDIREFGYE